MRGYLARAATKILRFTAPRKSKATVEVTGGAIAGVLEESRAPLIGPLVTARSYPWRQGRERQISNAKDPYTVTLKLD